jgi:tRNA-splicing ligase RtcB
VTPETSETRGESCLGTGAARSYVAAAEPVPIRLFSAPGLAPEATAAQQLRRLAQLRGLCRYVAVLPDVHHKPRNPTPTGTVAVTRDTIVPRAIDGGINCGLRLLAASVPAAELSPAIIDELYGRLLQRIPLKRHETPLVGEPDAMAFLTEGLGRLVEALDLPAEELSATECGGRALPHLDPAEIAEVVSARALRKGLGTLGTVGAGNHFLELQEIAQIIDAEAARRLGLERGGATFMVHSDSRGLGKRILKPLLEEALGPDADPAEPELWTIEAGSTMGRRLLAGLAAATHAGFANRAAVSHILRRVLREVLADRAVQLRLVVDCGHESIHLEDHDGERLWVHRHGASHALPPPPQEPDAIGQAVPVAGCMGSDSYLCVAAPAVRDSFCSVAHGAGRVMEKARAAEVFGEEQVEREVAAAGVRLYRYHADDIGGQAPASFKDVCAVVAAMSSWGLVRPVARLRPVAVLKG